MTISVGIYEWMLRFGSILEWLLASTRFFMTFVYQVGGAFVVLLIDWEGELPRIHKCEKESKNECKARHHGDCLFFFSDYEMRWWVEIRT